MSESRVLFPLDPIEDNKRAPSRIRRSRGHTPAGKLRSSRNSLRSGLFAKASILPDESSREYSSLLKNLAKSIRPENEFERALTEKIANIVWRQRRLLRAERAEIEKAQHFLGMSSFTQLPDLGDGSLAGGDELQISENHLSTNDPLGTLREEALLVPPLNVLVRLTAYERHLGRELDRVLSQLERIRGLRKNASPSDIDVTHRQEQKLVNDEEA